MLTSTMHKVCGGGAQQKLLVRFLTVLQLSELAPEDPWLPGPKVTGGGARLSAFCLSPRFRTQPSAASHPGRLFFPSRNCFQVTCLRHFPAALLTLAHLLVTLRAQTCARAQRAVRTTPACQTLPEDRDGWVNGAAGEIFTFKPGCSILAL